MDGDFQRDEPVPAATCPVCSKPADASRKPFCSARCANIDLGRWLGEKYRVPTSEAPEQPQTPEEDS